MDDIIPAPNSPSPAGAYSQFVEAAGLLFTAGMGPMDPETGEVVGTDIATQTEQVLRNLDAVLASRGRTLADVVKTTVHLADVVGDFAEFNETYRRIMPSPFPVRTTVGSVLPRILVEIDMVATAG